MNIHNFIFAFSTPSPWSTACSHGSEMAGCLTNIQIHKVQLLITLDIQRKYSTNTKTLLWLKYDNSYL